PSPPSRPPRRPARACVSSPPRPPPGPPGAARPWPAGAGGAPPPPPPPPARRWRSRLPVSATATPGWRLRTSAMIEATAERFCLSDRMSPSSTSSVSAPTYTPASVPRLLPHLVGLDHVAEVDVVVAEADAALEALADLGDIVL